MELSTLLNYILYKVLIYMFSVLQTSHLTEKVNLDDKQGIVNPEFSDIELETKGGDTEKITRF